MKKRIALLVLALTTAFSAQVFADELTESEIYALEEGELGDEEYYDFFDDTVEIPESGAMTEAGMENPFGDPVAVMVWEGIESETAFDETASTLSTYANLISVSYELVQSSEDPVSYLKMELVEKGKLNMGYSGIELSNCGMSEDQAWAQISCSGKGMTPYVDIIMVRKVGDGVLLNAIAEYASGTDAYGADYTPADEDIAKVLEALVIREEDGTDNGIKAEDIVPDAVLHTYTIKDEKVGEKTIYHWEDEPYLMTATDYAAYEDQLADEWADAESEPEELDEDFLYDGEDYENEVLSDGEYAAEVFSDVEYTESIPDDEFFYEEDGDDGFVAYYSTSARGIFVSSEIYQNEDPDMPQIMMDAYLENLSYFGAVGMKRSEITTTDNAAWFNVEFSADEVDEAYQGLRILYAVFIDENSYTSYEIYIPSDADEACLNDYLDAIQVKLADATIDIEQITFDYEAALDEYEEFGDDAVGEGDIAAEEDDSIYVDASEAVE